MRFDWSTSVFPYSTLKLENSVSDEICCFQVVRIYSFMNKIKLYIRASYFIFPVLKLENNNFLKHFLYLYNLVKTSAKFVSISEQVKTLDCLLGFHWSAVEFSQTFATVSIGYWNTENMLYFLIIIYNDKLILFLSFGVWVVLLYAVRFLGLWARSSNSKTRPREIGFNRPHFTSIED